MPPEHKARKFSSAACRKPRFAPDSAGKNAEKAEQKRQKPYRPEGDRQIEILAEAERFINVKNKRRQTNGSEMQNKRRVTALFEKNENADAEPDHTDERQKNHRRRPARHACQYVLKSA